MRKILFKAKRVDNGEWVEGDLLQVKYADGRYHCSIMPNTPSAANHQVDPATVCQFTGLTDKNGKEIFEGDIVRNGYTNHLGDFYKNGVVVYVENDSCFEIANDECYFNRLTRTMVVTRNIEVIVSIHDAPVDKEGE